MRYDLLVLEKEDRSDTRLGRGGPVKNISSSWHFSQTAGIVLLKSWAMIPCLKKVSKASIGSVPLKTNVRTCPFPKSMPEIGHRDLWRPLHAFEGPLSQYLWERFVKYSASTAFGDLGPGFQLLKYQTPGLKGFRVDAVVIVQIQVCQGGVLF